MFSVEETIFFCSFDVESIRKNYFFFSDQKFLKVATVTILNNFFIENRLFSFNIF